MGEHVRAGDLDIWTEQVGEGPEVLAFPHKQSNEDVQSFLDALLDYDTTDRLPQIAAPTLGARGWT